MNEFELGVMAYHLEKVGWFLPQGLLKASNLKIDLNHYSSYNQKGLKSFHLHLCCLAFMVKSRLNDVKELQPIQFYLEHKVYTGFAVLYASWSSINQPVCQVDPKVLNSIFNRLTKVAPHPRDDRIDYNSLVDTIIEISPPYSAKDDDTIIKNLKKRQAIEKTDKTAEGNQSKAKKRKPNKENSERFPQELQNNGRTTSSGSNPSQLFDFTKNLFSDQNNIMFPMPNLPFQGSMSTFNPQNMIFPFQSYPSQIELAMWNNLSERQESVDFFGCRNDPLLSAASSKNEINNFLGGNCDIFSPEMQHGNSSVRREGFREPNKQIAGFPFEKSLGGFGPNQFFSLFNELSEQELKFSKGKPTTKLFNTVLKPFFPSTFLGSISCCFSLQNVWLLLFYSLRFKDESLVAWHLFMAMSIDLFGLASQFDSFRGYLVTLCWN